MITPSPAAIEAAAKFWEFLGQHGTAKTIRERKGFRTTGEVFAQFEEEVTAPFRDDAKAWHFAAERILTERANQDAERNMMCNDKEINDIIQTRIETGVWRINDQGFLTQNTAQEFGLEHVSGAEE